MKTTLLILLVICTFQPLLAQEKYSKVKLDVSADKVIQLSELGIDLSEVYRAENGFETIVKSDAIEQLKQAGIGYEVLIDDMSAYYQSRNTQLKSARVSATIASQPANWELGSMGGYYTLTEIMRELDDMRTLYPHLITERTQISDTLTEEGRPIYWLRISDNADSDEDEPEILYTALHHAREPITVMQMIWHMWFLLENYETDGEIKTLVDNTEMYFIPVVNPDGYAYNEEIQPNGGGMWRKNRRNNLNGSYGVDLNRNYGYQWGSDNWGSSGSPVKDTYRGLAAFSEPETKNIRHLTSQHDFKIVLNYHSYSDMVIYPWGYKMGFTSDDFLFRQFSDIFTWETNYAYGAAGLWLYPANGTATDWYYAGQPASKKSYAFTIEVGDDEDGFWPASETIAEHCHENMQLNINAAKLVGKHAIVSDITPAFIGDDQAYIKYSIEYLGLTPSDEIKVTLGSDGESGVSKTHSNVSRGDFLVDSIQMPAGSMRYANSETIDLVLTTEVDSIVFAQNIQKRYSTLTKQNAVPTDTVHWLIDKWSIDTNETPFGNSSFLVETTSSDNNRDTSYVTYDTVVDLRNAKAACLNFKARWDMQPLTWVYLRAQNVDSTHWDVLSSKKSDSLAFYRVDTIPAYRGISDWSFEEVDLNEYLGHKIRLGFMFINGGFFNHLGSFQFSDFTILTINDTETEAMDQSQQPMCTVYPNPASTEIRIGQLPPMATIQLYALNGQLVKTKQTVRSEEIIDISDLSKGMYMVRVVDALSNRICTGKLVIE